MSAPNRDPEGSDTGSAVEREDAERVRDDRNPDHPDRQADLRERADGANEETISDEANLRANPDPPE